MLLAGLVALLAGAGAYAAAERGGRSAEFWLLVNAGLVLGTCVATHLAAVSISTSNDILVNGGQAMGMAVVLSAPLAGVVVGLLVIVWLLRTPRKPSLGSPIRMMCPVGDEGLTEVAVRFEPGVFVVRRGDGERRIEVGTIGGVEIDGEYLVVRVRGESDALRLRPIGDEYRDRQRAVALVVVMAARLREGPR